MIYIIRKFWDLSLWIWRVHCKLCLFNKSKFILYITVFLFSHYCNIYNTSYKRIMKIK